MIDTLLKNRENFLMPDIWHKIKLKKNDYIVITLHRPSNVDDESRLNDLINEIIKTSRNIKLVFPVHPRTKKIIKKIAINNNRLFLIKPLPYLEFNFCFYLCCYNRFRRNYRGNYYYENTATIGITRKTETVEIGTNNCLRPKPVKVLHEKIIF